MSFTQDVVIGLEIHAELNTKTKLFSSCPTTGSEEPNTRVDVVSLGMPGSKPTLNKTAVDYAIRLCIAFKCKIAPQLIFSRKSYFYPDLAKNYQITQYELPLGTNGSLAIPSGKKIHIQRLHLEEDPAALVHPAGMRESSYVLVDYNRSGNPLVEIVTGPDMASPSEARDFMKQLTTVLSYLNVYDENKGVLKADANISIKESGYIRTEVKNITGFKEIERALTYEISRQQHDVKEGKKLRQETRSWDSAKGVTFPLRSKETEEDYGYIIEPDLVPIDITPSWIEEEKTRVPELAQDKIGKFMDKHGLKKEDAEILSAEKELAELFERVAAEIDPVLAAKWLRRELVRVLHYHKKTLKEIRVDESNLIVLLRLLEDKKITDTVGQRLMEKLVEGPFDVMNFVHRERLLTVSDSAELEKLCQEAIQESSTAVTDYKSGNEKALNYVVGVVMKKTKGKADPQEVLEVLKKLLA